MPLRQTGGVGVRIDPKEWYHLKQQLDALDPKLTSVLRKRIRNAGNIAADQVKATLRLPNPEGGTGDEGRMALIAATKVSVSFSGKVAGAKIRTSSSDLDDKHKGLLFVYNKDTFRHPVFESNRQGITRTFGGTEKSELAPWVTENGRPYFGAVITKMLNYAIYKEIYAAFDDAFKSIKKAKL